MIQDRIVAFERIPASKLVANPNNWRRHPERQRRVMNQMLETIGFAGAVLVRDTGDGTYEIIDGHLRTDMLHDQDVPVLVTDLTADEALTLLATLDPLSQMATVDETQLEAVLRDVAQWNTDLQDTLATIADDYDLDIDLITGFGDLEPEPAIDFTMVELVVRLPKHRHTPEIEAQVKQIADDNNLMFRVRGAPE